jgi:two-component system OmpR family sensor kinase
VSVLRDSTPGETQVPAASDRGANEDLVRELREAVRARDDFIAIAAHELRNPITPIQLSVQLIRTAEVNQDYGRLTSEIDRLERLLTHFLRRAEVLLDITQLISERVHLDLVQVDLSQLVNDAIDDLRFLLTQSGSDLVIEIEANIIGVLDAVACRQIVDNLLSNAIKYGGGKSIELRLDQRDGCARFKVRDYGAGISSEDQSRIFEPFERVVKNTGKPGFGLGLWVSRRLAEAMQGSIAVHSDKGGSLFTMTIPLKVGSHNG